MKPFFGLSIGLLLFSLIVVNGASATINATTFTPTMTNNTAPAGYVAMAASEFSTDYMAYRAFNHTFIEPSGSGWISTNTGGKSWIRIQFPTGHVVKKYQFTSPGVGTNNQRAPRTWDLLGSNDGVTWTIIDTNSTGTYSDYENRSFETQNTNSYKYFNVSIKTTTDNTYVSLNELCLFEDLVTVPNVAFTTNVTSGLAPLALYLNDTSTGSPTMWNTSWGDGPGAGSWTNQTSFPATNITHIYLVAGNYTLTEYATNSYGTGSASLYINVSAAPSAPTVIFTTNVTSGVNPLAISLNDTSTGSPIMWNTSWGDGPGAGSWTNQTSFPPTNITHIYSVAGNYTLTEYATNAYGTGSASKYINVTTPVAPTAAFSGTPTSGTVPLTVQFTDTSTGSPTSWSWSFGDGGTSTVQNPSYVYNGYGYYSVSLNATNNIGSNTTTKSNYIHSISNKTGQTRQDTVVSPLYPIVIYVKDAQTSNPITSATVTDSFGVILSNSGSGSFAGSYPYGINTFNVQAPNYYPTTVAESVLGASTFTVQLTGYGNVTSTSTVWYSPRTVQFGIVDVYGNELSGATINAHYNSSTLPSGVSDLINNYGMNINAANEALNGTLIMSGTTDSMGSVVFTMMQTIKYDITVSYGGNTNTYSFYPQQANYQLKFIVPSSADNIWNDLYANGNTKVWATEPDVGNVTFWWSFQDMTALTTRIDFYLKDVTLNTTVYSTNVLSPTAGGIYQLNYTVPNVRGENYQAWENYTRSA